MLMMYLMFFMGFVSVWVAGRISADVQAALGLVNQCGIFLMVVSMAVSSGATAAVSQSLGARKILRAKRYITATITGCLILGLIVGFLGWLCSSGILHVIMVPESILPQTREMWLAGLPGLPAQYLYAATGVMFRATRQVLPPLWVAAIVCLCNLIACLGLGLGWFGMPACGYLGLVWANVASQYLGAICNCLLLMRSGYLSRRALPNLRWLKPALPYLLKVALPAGAASLVWQSGYMALFILVASLPHDSVNALAGLTAGLRVESLLFLPGMAFNMSAAVLVGNSLGEGKPEQARRLALNMTAVAAVILTIVAIALWPFRQELAALLAQESGARAQIVNYLTYNLLSTPFSIASTVMGGVMVGAGATRYNLMIFGGSFWGLRLPLGWLLGHMLWGTASGVFLAMLISQVVQSCVMIHAVRYWNWTRFAMRAH
ncbi:MAG: MATE family efflux transporter [Desulfovibrio sp.]|nr:MATE family efflux transporter [Desulfovibrio sp.]